MIYSANDDLEQILEQTVKILYYIKQGHCSTWPLTSIHRSSDSWGPREKYTFNNISKPVFFRVNRKTPDFSES